MPDTTASIISGVIGVGIILLGLTPHGLRHTLGTLLKEAGMSDGGIADVLGQEGTAMSRHYSREAALPEQARAAVIGLKMTAPKTPSGTKV